MSKHLRLTIPTWAEDAVRDQPPLMSERELAELLGVSRRTVARWRAAGKVKAIRTDPGGSGRVRFARLEVARLLATMAGGAA